MTRPAPGYMTGDQIINLIGNYVDVFALIHGMAWRIETMEKIHDGSGDYTAHTVNRHGRGKNQILQAGNTWYITRRELVNWPR